MTPASPESNRPPPRPLFRPEAQAHHRRANAEEPLEPLRIGGARVLAAYRGTCLVLALSIATLCVVHVDARVRGRFHADRAADALDAWHVTATFPWRYGAALLAGGRLELADDGDACAATTATIERVDASAAGRAGEAVQPIVIVHARAEQPCARPVRSGTAEAVVDRAPLLAVLFPRLRAPLARLREAL